MPKAPKSYINQRRPQLLEAIQAEGNVPIIEAVESLKRKGYFTARPRPWRLGFHDRGLGRGDLAVVDRFGDIVAEVPRFADVGLIIAAVNTYKPHIKNNNKKK